MDYSNQKNEEEKQEFEFKYVETYKVIFVGDSGIGNHLRAFLSEPEAFLNKISHKLRFRSIVPENYLKNIKLKVVKIPNTNNEVKLEVWDTAGDEKFRNVVKLYYRDANAVVLCYDITLQDSFDNLKTWMNEVNQNLDRTQTKIILCGCKCDLDDIREVETKVALKTSKEHDFKLFETSAKTGAGVEYMFNEIARMLYQEPVKKSKKNTLRIVKQKPEEKSEKSFFSKMFSLC